MVRYLSGHRHPLLATLARPDLGVMLSPNVRQHPPPGLLWAFDNGAFSGRFNDAAWTRWLDWLRPARDRCLFVVAPDVVGDAAATWERSRPYLPRIRALGYRAALAIQDGQTEPHWDAFDCLFVGGSTAFKLSETAWALVAEGRRRGKWIHMGRVNTISRLRAAAAAGIHSVDGTKLRYAPDFQLPILLRWLDAVNTQAPLG